MNHSATVETELYFFLIFPLNNRINTPRKQGGLGPMKIPLLSDLTHQISKDYGVYLEDQGHTLRYSLTFIAVIKVLQAINSIKHCYVTLRCFRSKKKHVKQVG